MLTSSVAEPGSVCGRRSAPGSGRICVKFVYASKQACSAGTVLAILFSLDWPNNGKKKTLKPGFV